MTADQIADLIARDRRWQGKLADIARVPDEARRTFYFRQHVKTYARMVALRVGSDPPDAAVILDAAEQVERRYTS